MHKTLFFNVCGILFCAFLAIVGLSIFASSAQADEGVEVPFSDLRDGDVVKTAHNPDVYILKITPDGGTNYKRLILNPAIFESYGHLKWENIKIVSQQTLNGFTTSRFVREVTPDGTPVNNDVYILFPDGDTGVKRLLQLSVHDRTHVLSDLHAIYSINHTEASDTFYKTGEPITSYAEYYRLVLDTSNSPNQILPAAPGQNPAPRKTSPQATPAPSPNATSIDPAWVPVCDSPTTYSTSHSNANSSLKTESCYDLDGRVRYIAVYKKTLQNVRILPVVQPDGSTGKVVGNETYIPVHINIYEILFSQTIIYNNSGRITTMYLSNQDGYLIQISLYNTTSGQLSQRYNYTYSSDGRPLEETVRVGDEDPVTVAIHRDHITCQQLDRLSTASLNCPDPQTGIGLVAPGWKSLCDTPETIQAKQYAFTVPVMKNGEITEFKRQAIRAAALVEVCYGKDHMPINVVKHFVAIDIGEVFIERVEVFDVPTTDHRVERVYTSQNQLYATYTYDRYDDLLQTAEIHKHKSFHYTYYPDTSIVKRVHEKHYKNNRLSQEVFSDYDKDGTLKTSWVRIPE